jgi:hypothetical protein
MKNFAIACAGLLASGMTLAENLEGTDKFLCAAAQVQICFETGECFAAAPWELSMPDFVVIDTKKKSVSTTKASGENRSTQFTSVEKSDGTFFLQGLEGQRLFSFVIEESTGHMTVAIVRDGFSVNVFGVCTDTDH